MAKSKLIAANKRWVGSDEVWRELFTRARGAGAEARVNNSQGARERQNFYPSAYQM
jgi:hypothetical protein